MLLETGKFSVVGDLAAHQFNCIEARPTLKRHLKICLTREDELFDHRAAGLWRITPLQRSEVVAGPAVDRCLFVAVPEADLT